MFKETQIAVKFLSSFIQENQRDTFENALHSELIAKFNTHWYPSFPLKGSAYRSIINTHKKDKILIKVASSCNININQIPDDLCIWIDPTCVSYRQGTNYIVTLWEYGAPIDSSNSIKLSPKSKNVTIKAPSMSPPPNRGGSPRLLRSIPVA
ncbi:Protein btg2 [Globomyces sp. JEL0801]|nr:Protein btg2 [Globomyces sp. JEL0801]